MLIDLIIYFAVLAGICVAAVPVIGLAYLTWCVVSYHHHTRLTRAGR